MTQLNAHNGRINSEQESVWGRKMHARKDTERAGTLPALEALEVDRRLARLADGLKRIARTLFFRDPVLLIGDDVQQKLLVLR